MIFHLQHFQFHFIAVSNLPIMKKLSKKESLNCNTPLPHSIQLLKQPDGNQFEHDTCCKMTTGKCITSVSPKLQSCHNTAVSYVSPMVPKPKDLHGPERKKKL